MDLIKHIDAALKEIDDEVQSTLLDIKIPLNGKDDIMRPLLQFKKTLDQTKEDLEYLIANPPAKGQACGISKYRED